MTILESWENSSRVDVEDETCNFIIILLLLFVIINIYLGDNTFFMYINTSVPKTKEEILFLSDTILPKLIHR